MKCGAAVASAWMGFVGQPADGVLRYDIPEQPMRELMFREQTHNGMWLGKHSDFDIKKHLPFTCIIIINIVICIKIEL